MLGFFPFLIETQELDLAEVVRLFPKLCSLMMTGKAGMIKNLEALGNLPLLQNLTILDLFGYSAEDMQILERIPGLRSLDLESISKETGQAARKKWKGRLYDLEVQKLRADDWLKDNLENPFRHWDGSDFVPVGAFKKTMQQYKKMKRNDFLNI